MADQQKIHPTDVEAPSAPLVRREVLRSENGNPTNHVHARQHYPPDPRTIPISPSKPPEKKSCCCRCICLTVCLFLLLMVLVAATVGALYLVFQPKVPTYAVNRLRISAFSVDIRLNVNASFNVTVTAKNPNEKIGIYYEDNSHLSVWYTDTKLCTGSLPVFYQGHRNTTVLNVVLTGHTQMGNNLLTALQASSKLAWYH